MITRVADYEYYRVIGYAKTMNPLTDELVYSARYAPNSESGLRKEFIFERPDGTCYMYGQGNCDDAMYNKKVNSSNAFTNGDKFIEMKESDVNSWLNKNDWRQCIGLPSWIKEVQS